MKMILARHADDDRLALPERPLTALGHAQSRALSRALATAGITGVFCSEARRARQTAAPVADLLGLTPYLDARLDEIRVPALVAGDRHPHPRELVGSTGNGEDWYAFLARVAGFVSDLCTGPAGATVLVVTHSGVFDAVHEILTGAGRRIELGVAHTGVSVWRHRPSSPAGRWLLECHNRINHLTAELAEADS
jgi:broad specificity phosphatase PhoE